MPEDETHCVLRKILDQSLGITQLELAAKVGICFGKINYCLRSLVEKGWVKMGNFRRSPNKLAYAYLLTASGIEEKTRITARFLSRKVREFERFKQKIERLRGEIQEADLLDEQSDAIVGTVSGRG
jgi:EPS-associated MarR family transcriptional regulator